MAAGSGGGPGHVPDCEPLRSWRLSKLASIFSLSLSCAGQPNLDTRENWSEAVKRLKQRYLQVRAAERGSCCAWLRLGSTMHLAPNNRPALVPPPPVCIALLCSIAALQAHHRFLPAAPRGTEFGTSDSFATLLSCLSVPLPQRIIDAFQMDQCLIFCRTNFDCDNLETFLNSLGELVRMPAASQAAGAMPACRPAGVQASAVHPPTHPPLPATHLPPPSQVVNPAASVANVRAARRTPTPAACWRGHGPWMSGEQRWRCDAVGGN